MRFFNPYFSTRRWLHVGVTVAGVVAGAAFGLVLTRLGKIVAGAPPATLANYAWNAAVFGVLAGIVSPLVTWSALRAVPLWRTIVVPLVSAVAGGCVAVIAGAPVLVLVLPPVGLALGFAHLHRRYPERQAVLAMLPGHEIHSTDERAALSSDLDGSAVLCDGTAVEVAARTHGATRRGSAPVV